MPVARSVQGFEVDLFDPVISSDLSKLSFEQSSLPQDFQTNGSVSVGPQANRNPESIRAGAVAHTSHSFMLDYYYRIHVEPLLIELGTIASAQNRTVEVWNSWPDNSAILTDIVLSDGTGITLTGPILPKSFNPLEETTYQIDVDSLGPPSINTTLQFDFANVPDPLPTLILGQRAVRFDLIPEVGVRETWEWLTDIMVSSDGTEQRISLRGPLTRTILEFEVSFLDSDPITRFAADLITANNSFWVPEWHYATEILTASAGGSSRLYYNPNYTDIRAGEYVILISPDQNSILVQASTLNVDGCNLSTPLTAAVPVGTYVSPGSVSLIKDNTTISRGQMNYQAQMDLTATFQRRRSTLAKPGSVSPLTTWNSIPVLDCIPRMNEASSESVEANLEVQDNGIGEIKYAKIWDYPRLNISREYILSRTPIVDCQNDFKRDIDYWKHFFDYTRGPQRKFWMPTFRDDFTLLASVAPGANSILVREKEYAQKVFSNMPTHRQLSIQHDAGVHRCTVIAALEESGGTRIVFTPSLPLVAGANIFKTISYLLPVRLASDSIQFEHFHSESVVSFSVRSAEL